MASYGSFGGDKGWRGSSVSDGSLGRSSWQQASVQGLGDRYSDSLSSSSYGNQFSSSTGSLGNRAGSSSYGSLQQTVDRYGQHKTMDRYGQQLDSSGFGSGSGYGQKLDSSGFGSGSVYGQQLDSSGFGSGFGQKLDSSGFGSGYGQQSGDTYKGLSGNSYGQMSTDRYGQKGGNGYGQQAGDRYGQSLGDSYGQQSSGGFRQTSMQTSNTTTSYGNGLEGYSSGWKRKLPDVTSNGTKKFRSAEKPSGRVPSLLEMGDRGGASGGSNSNGNASSRVPSLLNMTMDQGGYGNQRDNGHTYQSNMNQNQSRFEEKNTFFRPQSQTPQNDQWYQDEPEPVMGRPAPRGLNQGMGRPSMGQNQPSGGQNQPSRGQNPPSHRFQPDQGGRFGMQQDNQFNNERSQPRPLLEEPEPFFGGGGGDVGGNRPRPDGINRPRPDGINRPRPDGGNRPRPDGGNRPRPDGGNRPRPDGANRPRPDGGNRPKPAPFMNNNQPKKKPMALMDIPTDDHYEEPPLPPFRRGFGGPGPRPGPEFGPGPRPRPGPEFGPGPGPRPMRPMHPGGPRPPMRHPFPPHHGPGGPHPLMGPRFQGGPGPRPRIPLRERFAVLQRLVNDNASSVMKPTHTYLMNCVRHPGVGMKVTQVFRTGGQEKDKSKRFTCELYLDNVQVAKESETQRGQAKAKAIRKAIEALKNTPPHLAVKWPRLDKKGLNSPDVDSVIGEDTLKSSNLASLKERSLEDAPKDWSELVILEHKEKRQDETATCILNQSADFSRLLLSSNTIRHLLPSGEEKYKCTISLEGKVLAQGTDINQQKAKQMAAKIGLTKLKETNYTIQIKTRKNLEACAIKKDGIEAALEKLLLTDPEDNVGYQLLMKIGWKGVDIGAAGKSESTTEPEQEKDAENPPKEGEKEESAAATDKGENAQGITTEFQEQVDKLMSQFASQGSMEDLIFSSTFSPGERAAIRNMARKYNLRVENVKDSKGAFYMAVQIKVPTQVLVQYLCLAKDNCGKYGLISPTKGGKALANTKEEKKVEATKVEATKVEATKVEATKDEAPKDEAPKDEAPKDEAPKDEAPKDETPKDVESEPTETTSS